MPLIVGISERCIDYFMTTHNSSFQSSHGIRTNVNRYTHADAREILQINNSRLESRLLSHLLSSYVLPIPISQTAFRNAYIESMNCRMRWRSLIISRTRFAIPHHSPIRTFASALDRKMKAVIVLGTTGSGKSKLAIDLAIKYNGEIVNADAIQMYRGLDRVSAKVTEDEKQGIPHHLMSFLCPMESFTVRDYYHIAMDAIKDITNRGKLPIIVGGTMYYIQSLLRPSLLEEDEKLLISENQATSADTAQQYTQLAAREDFESDPARESPHELLRKVDPIMANRLHPNDTRKILRSLEVFNTTGIPYSTVLQKQAERLRSASGGLDAFVFWLQVRNNSVLNKRLDDRVRVMVDSGLEKEIQSLFLFIQSHKNRFLTAERVSSGISCTNEQAQDMSTSGVDHFSTHLPLPDETSLDKPTPLTMKIIHEYKLRPDTTSATSTSPTNSRGLIAQEMNEESQRSFQGLLQAIGYKEFEEYLHEWSSLGCPSITQIRPLISNLILYRMSVDDLMTAWMKYNRQVGGKSQSITPSSYSHVYGSAAGKRTREGEDTTTCSRIGVPTEESLRDASRAVISQALQDVSFLVKITTRDNICDYVVASGDKVDLSTLYHHFESGVEKLENTTHLYAKKQDRWIRNRFASRGVEMFPLDTSLSSEGSNWDRDVRDPAIAAMQSWYFPTSDKKSDDVSISSEALLSDCAGGIEPQPEIDRILEWKQKVCDFCGGKILNGQRAWEDHFRSKKHRKNVKIQENMRKMGMTYVEGMCLKEYYRRLNEQKQL